MKIIAKFLLNGYSKMPRIFFAAVLLCWLYSIVAWGGINWQNDAYEKHFPILAILSHTTGFLLFLFPLVVVAVLIFNYRKWRTLLPALLAYSLYLGFIILAGYMGWWMD